ncbi:MAG: sulfatase [Planctomycetia bacterium]|nr:sulfatase [Planctomycetia bacterium]
MKFFYGISFLLALFFGVSEIFPAEKKPNIIFIMSDDHTAEAISCYSELAPHLKGVVQTPNIDRIAEEGMRFDRVFCNFSLCSPSRASIMTGQYSHRTGVRMLNGRILESCNWVSEELQKAGYKTALIGKWHLQNVPKGFDHYCIVKEQGDYFDPLFITPEGEEKCKGYATDVYTDKALQWLESVRETSSEKDAPFCLMLHYKATHYPFDYPPRYENLYEGKEIPEPENMYEDRQQSSPLLKARTPSIVSLYYPLHKDDKSPLMKKPENDSPDAITKVGYQHIMHKYLRCAKCVDENVGRVLAYLDENGLTKNTVIIYTSDQGYWLGQHGLYDKRIILDESIRMPFVVRYPKEIPSGSVCGELISNVDFAQTLMDFAGIKEKDVPENMQGYSFRSLMRGEVPARWREGLFYCYTSQPAHWGVRTKQYTLACFPDTEKVELYDNFKDPRQNVNVAENPEYAEVLKEMKAVLARVMEEIEIDKTRLPGGVNQYENDCGEEAPL